MLLNKERRLWHVFLIAAATSTIIFLPFVIYNKGIFLFFGDYNVQMIPFYQTAVDAVRSGNITYSFLTDLGTGFLPAYGYYMLGSPFFYIACLFPASWTPYLMAPLYVLKFAVGATTAYLFLKRFVKNPDSALVGALLYSFSGFNVYNIFFFLFNDVTAFFPLLLVSLEETVVNRRKGLFALSVALMASINYFFFFGQAVFLIIYFIFRIISGEWKGKFNFKTFLSLATETILGVGLSAIILLPSVMYLLSNPRVDNLYTGMSMFIYNFPQRYGAILQSFFFPPELPSRPNFFPDSNAKWASLSAYMPLFSVSGVLAFFYRKRRHWLKSMSILLFVFALVPITNSMFYAFNASYYARWYYMLILMMALMTAKVIDTNPHALKRPIAITSAVVVAFSLIGVAPKKDAEGGLKWFSLPPYPDRFWAYVAFTLFTLLLLTLTVKFFASKKELFLKVSIAAVCLVSIGYSVIFIALGKTHSYDDTFILNSLINEGEDMLLGDESEFYRVDEFQGMDNTPLFWGKRSIRYFHTCVSSSIMEFYPTIGVKRDVSSKPTFSYYTLRAFLSTKYIFSFASRADVPETLGFTFAGVQGGYAIYQNENYIPMGFSYTHYITEDEYYSLSESRRERLLTKAIVLTKEQADKYSSILHHLPLDMQAWGYNAFTEECDKLKESSASSFKETKKGFTADFTAENDTLLFFSVPYDKGFKAYVNGVETEVEKVTVGFSAVKVGKGENKIEFVYTPEGYKEGIIISLSSLLLLSGYLSVNYVISKRKSSHIEIEE